MKGFTFYIMLKRIKEDWITLLIALMFILMYLTLESWHLADSDVKHIFPSGFWLSQIYYELFRNEDIAKFFVFINTALSILHIKNGGKVSDLVPFWSVYLLYLVLDIQLYFYNGNTEHESIIYFLCGLLDLFFVLRRVWINLKRVAKI